jgi:phosphoribosylaminoimidazole-succinocarboxamide synthase
LRGAHAGGHERERPLPCTPIITPATKAEEGHDEDISKEDIIAQNIISADDYALLEKYTYALFERGTQMAAKQGLILVDTKYEFGKKDGKIYLIDEIHTPDSSRYFYKEGYEERQKTGERQKQLSKEFVREWLMAHGFQGLEGQMMPVMPNSFVDEITDRYVELFEKVSGQSFNRVTTTDDLERIEKNVTAWLKNNS